MITIGDLDKIITRWKLKLAEPVSDEYDAIYNDGINDCLYDLNNLIEERMAEEDRAFEYMNQI